MKAENLKGPVKKAVNFPQVQNHLKKLEQLPSWGNLLQALKRVEANIGSHGGEGVSLHLTKKASIEISQ
ncbi:hypothetical protein HGO21_03285 [Acinetobacter sp. CUI P1]|nr:hypothetical protein [Acinetobacter sp. CUI P1]